MRRQLQQQKPSESNLLKICQNCLYFCFWRRICPSKTFQLKKFAWQTALHSISMMLMKLNVKRSFALKSNIYLVLCKCWSFHQRFRVVREAYAKAWRAYACSWDERVFLAAIWSRGGQSTVRNWRTIKVRAHTGFSAILTRLAFAGVLGPFGVHLLKLTLDIYPGSLMHYLVGLLEFPVRICDALHITAHTRRT